MAASGPPGGLDAKPRAELSALMSSSPTNERTDSIPVEGREPGRPGFRGHRMQGSGLMAWLRRYTEGRPDHILAIGFTMVEMLIVMAIIGTLLAIALPMLRSALDTARVTRAIGDISALQTDMPPSRPQAKVCRKHWPTSIGPRCWIPGADLTNTSTSR